ncbi:p21-activated protein kinase-interacting protein 1-like [Tubulanus polymorphus]|uniref:p21-activated protein kinase-interacting protein 1-like n=1 Tax=Tubulanus polymorphus TaxID=672921 RepID=UPI003DA211D0
MVEVVAGCYEELTLAYKLFSENLNKEWKLEPSFTDHSHTGCVKALAISPKGVLATGSSDETIKLFNVRKRVELGSLMHHDGTINCIDFYKNRFMFSGSCDGTIGVWNTSNWECLKTLRGHQGSVHSVAVHPSGKLALSIGADKTLRTWNLMTCRKAFIKKLKKAANQLLWSPDGEKYIVGIENSIDIFQTATTEIEHTITCDSKIHRIVFCGTKHLLVALETGNVDVYDIETNERKLSVKAHSCRVKCMYTLESGEIGHVLFTVCSDGLLKAWGLILDKESIEMNFLAEVDTSFRLMCVTAWNTVANETTSERIESVSAVDSAEKTVSETSVKVQAKKRKGKVEIEETNGKLQKKSRKDKLAERILKAHVT